MNNTFLKPPLSMPGCIFLPITAAKTGDIRVLELLTMLKKGMLLLDAVQLYLTGNDNLCLKHFISRYSEHVVPGVLKYFKNKLLLLSCEAK